MGPRGPAPGGAGDEPGLGSLSRAWRDDDSDVAVFRLELDGGFDVDPWIAHGRAHRGVLEPTADREGAVASRRDEVVVVGVPSVSRIATTLDQTLYGTRMGATLLGVFAALALGLAAVGIYGVLAYSVNERTAEIGLRLALGAAPRDVLWLVVRDGLILAAGGVVVGLAASYGLGRFVATLLYDVPPSDPLTLASVAIVLVAVSLAACLIPCRRAMKVSALTVLR